MIRWLIDFVDYRDKAVVKGTNWAQVLWGVGREHFIRSISMSDSE